MITPSFLEGVQLTDEDAERLSHYINSWATLNEFFKSDVCRNADLDRLVLLELNGRGREQILDRLLQRRSSKQRSLEMSEIKYLLGKNTC